MNATDIIAWTHDADVYCALHAPPGAAPVFATADEVAWAERQICGTCARELGGVDAGRTHPIPAGAVAAATWPTVHTVGLPRGGV